MNELSQKKDLADAKVRREAERARRIANVMRFCDGERTIQEVANMAGVTLKAAKHIIAKNRAKP